MPHEVIKRPVIPNHFNLKVTKPLVYIILEIINIPRSNKAIEQINE